MKKILLAFLLLLPLISCDKEDKSVIPQNYNEIEVFNLLSATNDDFTVDVKMKLTVTVTLHCCEGNYYLIDDIRNSPTHLYNTIVECLRFPITMHNLKPSTEYSYYIEYVGTDNETYYSNVGHVTTKSDDYYDDDDDPGSSSSTTKSGIISAVVKATGPGVSYSSYASKYSNYSTTVDYTYSNGVYKVYSYLFEKTWTYSSSGYKSERVDHDSVKVNGIYYSWEMYIKFTIPNCN